MSWAESVTYTFSEVASANSWENGVAYTDVTLGNFHFEVTGGGNNGKYYTSDTTWRFYSGGGLTITATDGSTITSISSDPTVTFKDGTASFSGTVKIKSITIIYTPVINYTITAATSNSTWGTVSLDGRVITATPKSGYRISVSNPYTVTSGTATVTDNKDNTFTVDASSDCTVQINFEAIPSYNYAFYSNGVSLSNGSKYEGEAIDFPADPKAINGKVFVGWTESAIDGITEEKPVVVRKKNMGSVDVNFYAVFASKTVGGSESTSISAYADGEYYIVDFYNDKYYAFSGAVASKKLAGIEVTSAVTANPDGSISVDLANASLTDEMPYAISLSAGNYTITNTKAGSDVILQKGGNDLGTEVSDPAIYWTGFEEGTDSQASRFSITAAGTNKDGKATSNCLLLQTSTWNSSTQSQDPTLVVKGYVQSNRGIVTAKSQCYASGYMWFVPTTSISYSNYCTTILVPTPENITISAAGYTTYYNSTAAYTMPDDCEGYVFTAADGLELAYEAEEVVPAGEPLVIYTIEPGIKTLVFTTSEEDTWKEINMNDLDGTDTETALTADDNSYFYGLSLNAAGETASVGFYWMNATGAAFTNGAHKAYLKLPKSSGARSGFAFNEDTEAISTIEAEATATTTYNLAGQRVNDAKGLVIKNGKKIFVK